MAQLSLTEVSKRFNINRTTVYRAVSSGKLSRLSNGMFDLAEVIRVFGEPAPVKSEPIPDKGSSEQSKLVEVLERELLFLKNQIEQKDKQINSLQLLLGTSAQRPEATQSNDTPQQDETPINKGLQNNETLPEANSNDTKQHGATLQNETVKHDQKHGLLNRLDKGIKAFFSK